MNYYVEQMEWITDALNTLNEFEKRHISDDNLVTPMFKNQIEIELDGDTIGWLVDEIGGVWSFNPVSS